MAELDKMKFVPEDGWYDTASFPNKQNELRNREMMNELPFQLRDFINSLIDQLQSATESSGTGFIGAYKIEGLLNEDGTEAITAKQQLEALKRLVDEKAVIDNVYDKSNTYNKTEIDELFEVKANSLDVYNKTDIDSKVDMTRGALASINGMSNAKGNISVIAGDGIKIEVDDSTKTIRVNSTGKGTGDMLKATYDKNNTGSVDNAHNLGGKPAIEYLLKSEQASDSAKLGGKSADSYIQSNPNLLANSDFKINTKGLKTYGSGTYVNVVDTWTANNVKIDVLDNGIKCTGSITNTSDLSIKIYKNLEDRLITKKGLFKTPSVVGL